MSKYLLSIIIPVYNLEKYIAFCLESLVEQINDSVEVIIIDDGSTDKSADIVGKYCEKYNYIKYFYQKNAGVSVARNYGLKQARGMYIQFIDGDDWILPNSLSNILDKIKSNKFDLIVGNYIKCYKEEFPKVKKIDNQIVSLIENCNYPNNIVKLLEQNLFCFSICFNIIKRSIIEENNIVFNEIVKNTEDMDFCLNAIVLCKKITLTDTFYAYRKSRKDSATSKISKQMVSDNFNFVVNWYHKIQNSNWDSNLKNQLLNFVSYEYSVVMGLLFLLDKNSFNSLYPSIKEYCYLLKLGHSKKVKLVRFINSILGYKVTGFLMAQFIKIKN